jgi:hypothetical protein
MSREVCEKIFEPFFTTKGATGMGLGLAVSYGTIERYGGRIEARSAPGSGTTFTITLPVAVPAETEDSPRHPREINPADALATDLGLPIPETPIGVLHPDRRGRHGSNGRGAASDEGS